MKLEINAIINIMLVHQIASLLAVIIDVVVSISSIFLHVVIIAIICVIIIHNMIGRMVYAASVRGIMEICIGQAWRKAEE